MSKEISHQMLDGKIIKAEVVFDSNSLLNILKFKDGRNAEVMCICSNMCEYKFKNGEKLMFLDCGTHRKQIDTSN